MLTETTALAAGGRTGRPWEFRVSEARQTRQGQQPLHYTLFDVGRDLGPRAVRQDMTLCHRLSAMFPENGARGRLESVTCRKCVLRFCRIFAQSALAFECPEPHCGAVYGQHCQIEGALISRTSRNPHLLRAIKVIDYENSTGVRP